MTSNPKVFWQRTSTLRNARDLIKKKQKELIAVSNTKVLIAEYSGLNSYIQNVALLSLNLSICLKSKMLTNKLTLDINTSIIFTGITFARV